MLIHVHTVHGGKEADGMHVTRTVLRSWELVHSHRVSTWDEQMIQWVNDSMIQWMHPLIQVCIYHLSQYVHTQRILSGRDELFSSSLFVLNFVMIFLLFLTPVSLVVVDFIPCLYLLLISCLFCFPVFFSVSLLQGDSQLHSDLSDPLAYLDDDHYRATPPRQGMWTEGTIPLVVCVCVCVWERESRGSWRDRDTEKGRKEIQPAMYT